MKTKHRMKRYQVVLVTAILMLGTGGAVMASACIGSGATPSKKDIDAYIRSPHYKNGRFINKVAAEDPPFFKTMKEWTKGAEHTSPSEAVPVEQHTAADFETPPTHGLRITWMGHSTSLVEIDGSNFLLDPMWSRRSSPFAWTGPRRFHDAPLAIDALPPIDAVLISHDHYDHLDKATVLRLARQGAPFVVPLGVGARLRSWGIDDRQIAELDWWDERRFGQVTITATPARHFSGRTLNDRNKTFWSGFAMAGPQHRVYYTGDTGLFPGFREIGQRLGPFDATLVEIGQYHQLWRDLHLGPEQAVQAVKDVNGGLLIPVHWATFELALHSWIEPAERIIMAAEKQQVSLCVPRPGAQILPSKPPEIVRWWPALPWQSAKEHPIIASGMAADLTTSSPESSN